MATNTPAGISSTDITSVDTASHMKGDDKLYIMTTVNGKAKLYRISPEAVIGYMLSSMGLAYDAEGECLCAAV